MQLTVVLLVNTIIPPILESLKDGIRELKYDFNTSWISRNGYLRTATGGHAGISREA